MPTIAQNTSTLEMTTAKKGLPSTSIASPANSSVDRSKIDPRVEVNTALRHMTRFLRVLMGEDIVVDLELDAPPSVTDLDREQFVRVITDLALKARHAMRGSGFFKIRTCDGGRRGLVEIELKDTGAGMSLETLENMLSPYPAVGPPMARTGLSEAYGIVGSAGGCIVCETVLGSGSTFRVLLPRVRQRPVEV